MMRRAILVATCAVATGIGGTARVVVRCGVANPMAEVAFNVPFDPPAGTTSVEVRVGAWTQSLGFVMSGNVLMLAGSSSSGLVDRIRAGSQLQMSMGPDDANPTHMVLVIGSEPVGDRQGLRESGTGTPVLPRVPNLEVLRGFMHQPPLHLPPPARLRLQRRVAGSGTDVRT